MCDLMGDNGTTFHVIKNLQKRDPGHTENMHALHFGRPCRKL